jgi:hypothetical protein
VCELEKIVSGADDGPLGAHLVDAAHQEQARRPWSTSSTRSPIANVGVRPASHTIAAYNSRFAHFTMRRFCAEAPIQSVAAQAKCFNTRCVFAAGRSSARVPQGHLVPGLLTGWGQPREDTAQRHRAFRWAKTWPLKRAQAPSRASPQSDCSTSLRLPARARRTNIRHNYASRWLHSILPIVAIQLQQSREYYGIAVL